MKIDGGCHCGTVRYEVDPAKVVICHCTDCQQLSGSTFRTVVQTNPDTFQLLSGVPKIYVKTCESGNRREQTFCPNCDTPIYSALVGDRPRWSCSVSDSSTQRTHTERSILVPLVAAMACGIADDEKAGQAAGIRREGPSRLFLTVSISPADNGSA